MRKLLLTSLLSSFVAFSVYAVEGVATDLNGNEVIIDITQLNQDRVTKNIYSNDGRTYRLMGTYQRMNNNGVLEELDCSQADFYGNPSIQPLKEANLPDASCKLVEVESNLGTNSKVYLDPSLAPLQHDFIDEVEPFKCYRVGSYAPPLKWSPWGTIGHHVVATTYRITATIYGSTHVDSQVKYFNNGWRVRDFITSTTITTSNAATYMLSRHRGQPFGSSLHLQIC
ncbi:hypothetical protein [Vibrio profundi]|uniref:hypothetical protein n=1 Tax=Vibrio profundi TaxID=1774960 RepID=UPI00373578B3